MTLIMPRVAQRPSPNYTPTLIRHDLFVFHMMEGGYAGSVNWLCLRASGASAHLCMNEDGSEVSQLVPLGMKAWAQCAFNGRAVSLEIPGFTAQGVADGRLRAAAGIAAWYCRAYDVPPVWAKGGQGRGVCTHHDLGAAGGGHVDICDVGDATWMKVLGFLSEAYDRLAVNPLPAFALHGLPNPHQAELPPNAPPAPSHGGAPRLDPSETPSPHPTSSGYPHGAVADLQWRLNRAGAAPPLKVDGFAGSQTRNALVGFQRGHGLMADGLIGPKTWAALDAASSI